MMKRPRFVDLEHPTQLFAERIVEFESLVAVEAHHRSMSADVLPEEYVHHSFSRLLLEGIQLQSLGEVILYHTNVLISGWRLG